MEDILHLGSRLEVARLILGQTRPEVAAALDISSSAYAEMERGHRRALPMLERLAETLSVDTNYLGGGPAEVIPAVSLTFRKRVSLKTRQVRHVQGMASAGPALREAIESFVQLPKLTISYTPLEGDENRNLQIESIVRQLRSSQAMQDAPLRSAVELAEALGIVVFWVHADADFDGVSYWHGGNPYILLNRDKQDGYRARFTVLHELGHIMLHRGNAGIEHEEETPALLDREANYFASALLLPATSFARHYRREWRLDDVLGSRHVWGASAAAMIRRAKELSLIDDDRYRKLNVSISVRGWRKREPGSPKPEGSKIHQFVLDEAGERGQGPVELAMRAPMPFSWVSELMPSAASYLRMPTVPKSGWSAGQI